MGTNFTPESLSSGLDTTNSLNTNFTNIQTALGRLLNVYGDSTTGTNAMQTSLDLNSNRIINGVDAVNPSDLVTKRQLDAYASGSLVSVDSSAVTYTPSGTGAVDTTVQAKLRESISVKDFGALGDGSTDDSAEFALAITAAANKVLIIPPSSTSYVITGNLTLSSPVTIYAYGATVEWKTDSTNQGMLVTSSNVTILGGTWKGPQFASDTGTQKAFDIYGTSSAAYISNIKIKDAVCHNWGSDGIELQYVEDFDISHNYIYDCYQRGIMGRSVRDGAINSNVVRNIDADGTPGTEAYGIQVTKSSGTEATHPVSRRVTISGNTVNDVGTWTGIDTHGGAQIVVTGNQIRDVRIGIGFAEFQDGTNASAPINCTISGNSIECAGDNVSIADTTIGIALNGNDGTRSGYAGYSLAINNNITGNSISNVLAGIQIRNDQDTVVSGNSIEADNRCFKSTGESLNLNVTSNSMRLKTTGGNGAIELDRGATGSYPTQEYGLIIGNTIQCVANADAFFADTGDFTYHDIGRNFVTVSGTGTVYSDVDDFLGNIEVIFEGEYTWAGAGSVAADAVVSDVQTLTGTKSGLRVTWDCSRDLDGVIIRGRPGTDQITWRLHNAGTGSATISSPTKFFYRVSKVV